jgi:hypothetical protein
MDHPKVNRRHQAIERLDTGASLFLDHRDPATVKWLGELRLAG